MFLFEQLCQTRLYGVQEPWTLGSKPMRIVIGAWGRGLKASGSLGMAQKSMASPNTFYMSTL